MSPPPDEPSDDGPDDDGPDDGGHDNAGPADAIDTAIDNVGAEVAGDATRRKRRRRRRRRDHGGDPATAPTIPNQSDAPTREGLAAEAPQDGGPRSPAPLDGEFAPAAPGDPGEGRQRPPQQQQRDQQRHRDQQQQRDPQQQRNRDQQQQRGQQNRDQQPRGQQQRGRDDRHGGGRRDDRGGDNRKTGSDNRQAGGSDNRQAGGSDDRQAGGSDDRLTGGSDNRLAGGGGDNRLAGGGGDNRLAGGGGNRSGGDNRGGDDNRGGSDNRLPGDSDNQLAGGSDIRQGGTDSRSGGDNRGGDNRGGSDNRQAGGDNRPGDGRRERRRRRDRGDGRDRSDGRERSEGRGAPRDQEPGGEADLREAADDILRGDPYRDGDASGAIESRAGESRDDNRIDDRGGNRDGERDDDRGDNRGAESRGDNRSRSRGGERGDDNRGERGGDRNRGERGGGSGERGSGDRNRGERGGDNRGERAARPSQPNVGGDSRRQSQPGGDIADEEDRVSEPTVAWGTDDGQPAPAVTLAADLPVDAPDDDFDPVTFPLVDGPGAQLGDDVASVVGIRFVPAGRIQWCDAGDGEFVPGERVMVDSDRGPRLAWIATSPQRRATRDRNLRRVMRRANDVDLRGELAGEHDRKELLRLAKDKAAQLRLPLKVFRVEKAGQKLNVYYTSDERLDLRDFVRDVGTATGLRLELRQLGVRDEAKMVGGIGSCGLTLCCTTWLPDFVPVSIKMAKDQGLVLSPTKVSGQCGRLKCCLVYEQAGYAEMRKGLPKLGKRVISAKGEGRVVEVDVLRQRIRVSYGPGDTEVLPASEVKPMFPSGHQQGQAHHEPEPHDDDDAEPDLPQS